MTRSSFDLGTIPAFSQRENPTCGESLMRAVFDRTLVRADHFRSFRVHPAPHIGWDASERQDDALVDQQHYSDWHRVEQAVRRFRQHIAELVSAGWEEA
jgi:hypothetical protein